MPEHRWARRLRSRGRLAVLLYALLATSLILGMTLSAGMHGGLAQDDASTPASDSEQTQAEQIVDEAADEPVEPPADEQVDTPVDEQLAVDESVDGGEQPTGEMNQSGETEASGESTPVDEIPTEEATATPSPTSTPLPSLIIAQTVTARCELAPQQPDEVRSGGTQQYNCQAELGLAATAVDPAQVAIDWQIDVFTGGTWSAQLRSDDEHPWSELDSAPVLVAQSTLDDVVAADTAGFETTEIESFQLLVIRPACSATPAMIQVQVSANPLLDGAAVGSSSLPEPLKLEPSLAAITQPTVIFDGPLSFGTIDADASGPAVSALSGTLGLTLSGMNTTCGSWQIAIGGEGMVDESGQPLTGSELLVLPTTDAGVPCDVRAGCPVAQVAGDAAADPTQSLALELELRLGDTIITGTFSASLTVTITPLDGLNSDGNGE